MTSADVMRFVIIVSLGVLAFITFLVAGTMIGLMWLDSWSCGPCKRYPVGMYILAILGVLLIVSIASEAGDAPEPWEKWIAANKMTLLILAMSLVAFVFVLNGCWWL